MNVCVNNAVIIDLGMFYNLLECNVLNSKKKFVFNKYIHNVCKYEQMILKILPNEPIIRILSE